MGDIWGGFMAGRPIFYMHFDRKPLKSRRMTLVRFLVLFFSFIASVSWGPAFGQTSIGSYSAYWIGLPVGSVQITSSLSPHEDRTYAFSMALQSGGILGSSRFTTTFTGHGTVVGTWLQPSHGHFADVRHGQTRTETITFDEGMPHFASAPQYIIPEEFQFDLSQARHALDPSSGLFMLLYAASIGDCNRQFRVYDGFSLYTARISDEGREDVRTRLYQGPTQKCRLSLTPIAGKAAVFGSFTVPEMEINVARLSPHAPALPVKGSLFINGNRAGLRFDDFHIQ